MQGLESDCLKFLDDAGIHIPFYKRYVEDIITAVPWGEVELVLEVFNSYEGRLQFTHEVEEDNKIAFLDLLLIHDNDHVVTNWYHKPIWSGIFLNFDAHHPISQKKGIISMLVDRCVILLHLKFHEDNLQLIRSTLLDNSYPLEFINTCIKERLHHLNVCASENTAAATAETDFKHALVLPFVNGLTQNLKRVSRRYGLNVISNTSHKLQSYLKTTKDPVKWENRSNVVYSIPCDFCNGVYVGQTKRYLKVRVGEHEKGVKNCRNTDPAKYTALTRHHVDSGHSFNFDKVKVCKSELHPYKRNLLEMLYIVREDNAVNFRSHVNGLSSVYTGLISKSRAPTSRY
ncbi:uncharacterized protein LOC107045008 [Diachasma alloeum]|uniref:uncharacterized protein LOC107045008 n=1 Tax=Diachasma alloeum TaxID=454923 RepID=UPI0007383827|nr:uncharacterized protein LOC107045008 [Diachasma alloeum]